MKQTSTELGDSRRRELLEAAFSLIGEKGLEGLRTRDIAARAGVNISTLHYYFGTKEALLVALIHYLREAFKAPRTRRRSAAGDASAGLRSHFADTLHSFRANPHLATVLQELVLRARRDRAARAALRNIIDDWNAKVEDLIRREAAGGALRTDVDPRAGAAIVTSFIMGATMQHGVSGKAFDFAGVTREFERWLAGAAR
jgi:AcrR family transcriptional regulator